MKRPAQVYAAKDVIKIIRKEFSYAFTPNPYPGVPVIDLHPISNKAFKIGNTPIIPVKALHYANNLHVFGFRINDFCYITDAVQIPAEEKEKIRGSRVLVLNALRKKKHYSHFNLEEALQLMEEFRPEQGYLTHISHQMGLHQEVEKELPPYVKLAYDGLKVTL
jgi:phosphoribosyl 1,2-cyclic phosphate phosphodiesterase